MLDVKELLKDKKALTKELSLRGFSLGRNITVANAHKVKPKEYLLDLRTGDILLTQRVFINNHKDDQIDSLSTLNLCSSEEHVKLTEHIWETQLEVVSFPELIILKVKAKR